jgi:hypothetical protein
VQRFEASGRVEQQGRRVTVTTRVGRQLGAQQLCPRPPQLIERCRLRHGQQPQRGVGRAGPVLGLRLRQRPDGPAAWLGGQLGGALAEGGRRQPATDPGPAG